MPSFLVGRCGMPCTAASSDRSGVEIRLLGESTGRAGARFRFTRLGELSIVQIVIVVPSPLLPVLVRLVIVWVVPINTCVADAASECILLMAACTEASSARLVARSR